MKATLSEEFTERAKKVLETWVDVERANLDRQRIGIRNFIVPHRYSRNEPPDMRETARYVPASRIVADDELEQAKEFLRQSLEFVGAELHKRKDIRAALTLLLHRRMYPGHLHPYMDKIIRDLPYIEEKCRQVGAGDAEQVIDEALAAKGCGAPKSVK